MTVEFIGLTPPNASNEIKPIPHAGVDVDFLIRYSRTLDDYGFNYTLVPYDSSSFDPWTIGATIAAVTKIYQSHHRASTEHALPNSRGQKL